MLSFVNKKCCSRYKTDQQNVFVNVIQSFIECQYNNS